MWTTSPENKPSPHCPPFSYDSPSTKPAKSPRILLHLPIASALIRLSSRRWPSFLGLCCLCSVLRHPTSTSCCVDSNLLMAGAMIRSALRSSVVSSSSCCWIIQAIRFKKSLSLPHEFSKASEFLGSWEVPKDPREAEKKLSLLRRDYAKQVKELRKQYFYEMELQRQEKQLKDKADRESILRAREERKAAKAALAEEQAAKRKVFEDEFRRTLLKEREEKLQNWRAKEEMREQKKGDKNGLIRRQSSMWIEEKDLEKKILEVIVDPTLL